MNQFWDPIDGLDSVPSPSLLVDGDLVSRNIHAMLEVVDGDAHRLRPHVKTHKMPTVIGQQLECGISKFKAATLAEAAMVAAAGGQDVLIAYPMVGANLPRLKRCLDEHPLCEFSVVVDSLAATHALADAWQGRDERLKVFIDIDCGMHRTGVPWGHELDELRRCIDQRGELEFAGLHIYDGHLHQPGLDERVSAVGEIRESLDRYLTQHGVPEIVVGGSPTFAIWARQSVSSPADASQPNIVCSPGTPVFWDVGYSTHFPDLPFKIAAALLTRIISKPGAGRICLDVGYKSVAAEMPLDQRLRIPAIPDAQYAGQSEEHLMVATNLAESLSIGEPLIAYPRHICPTVALHDEAYVIRQSAYSGERWPVVARTR